MSKISGVYKITNNITGDLYIGSSKNIKHRWVDHKSLSTWKHYPNSRMYQDMQNYSLNNFKFEVIEETDSLREREQYWINELHPSYNSFNVIGRDLEKYNEWYKLHRKEINAKGKEWRDTHREEFRNDHKKCNNKLCLYEDEILTINTLSSRLHRKGIPHAWLEAKKYLLEDNK